MTKLVAFCAFWGAILSTWTAYNHYQSKRWRVIVTSTIGWTQEKKTVFARAVNFGERSVALKKWWIETPINKTGRAKFLYKVRTSFGRRALADAISSPSFVISSGSLPSILEPGRSFELILDAEAMQAKLADGPWNELTVVFEDEAGNLYAGRRMLFQSNQIRLS